MIVLWIFLPFQTHEIWLSIFSFLFLCHCLTPKSMKLAVILIYRYLVSQDIVELLQVCENVNLPKAKKKEEFEEVVCHWIGVKCIFCFSVLLPHFFNISQLLCRFDLPPPKTRNPCSPCIEGICHYFLIRTISWAVPFYSCFGLVFF